MLFQRGDICYILKNNCSVHQAKVISRQGNLYTIQLIGTCGATRLPSGRLFKTPEDAEASKKPSDPIVKVQISAPEVEKKRVYEFQDVFEGKRTNRNPHSR